MSGKVEKPNRTLQDYERKQITKPQLVYRLVDWETFAVTHTREDKIVGLAATVYKELSLSGVILVFEATTDELRIEIAFNDKKTYHQDMMCWSLASERTDGSTYCARDEYGMILSYPEHILATKIFLS